jgi:UDP-N-acetylmuramoyl-tripeptide--D-alanyl-D-alanine ligase
MSAPVWLFIWIIFLIFAARRLILLLHVFQQDEYDAPRFLKWIVTSRSYDKRLSVNILLLVAVAYFIPRLGGWILVAIVGGFLLTAAWRERNPLKDAKKKLVLTARAKRIFVIAMIYAAATGFAFSYLYLPPILWIIPIQGMPLMLALAVWTLAPQEALVQRRYWREAHEKFSRLGAKVIGITGSFGKTSAKHILSHVLESASSGLATPGSVNTPMGIARIVREQLRPEHRYFIAEMGAYGPGSINRLCKLAPPDFAVITAIGKAHYERFKTLETVADAKFELAEATVARGGKVIVTEDVLSHAPARAFADRYPDAMIVCGEGETCDLRILAQSQTKDGLSLFLAWLGETYEFTVPIFGTHQITNIALAFAAACAYGAHPETVALALKSTPQITHRFEVKPGPNGAVLVDDAYNSNPKGFASALEALDILVEPSGQRILATPGMVELGDAHDEEHTRLGEIAAAHVDTLLAIAPSRIESFVDAFEQKASDQSETIRCKNFAEANDWITENAKFGDVVLLENDLPDLYERRLGI